MEFKTIKEDGMVQEEIKKSRFICHVKRVYSEEEARAFIAAIKKEHYKATHNCSAFVIGEKSDIKRTSDDGEPSGTAGVPMLGVLEKHELTNLCVVVTRYFGGIKLGAGGLIRAYAGSVALAIKEIGLVEIKEQAGLRLQLSYSQYQDFTNFLKVQNLEETDTIFTELVDTTIYIDKNIKEITKRNLTEFFNGKIELTDLGLREVEVHAILDKEN
ncbi:YigZ family protein [Streptococcus sanguinis]|uniref:YigZ family protein n=1 Tax=Streptococcus sanguinis TaxID=1305 RepID=UPI001CBB80B3|nr:YigZ family protein [Streptococcus sanguinis]MBZ2066734.1 YigZ family protein [Streptococcus sanguinis]